MKEFGFGLVSGIFYFFVECEVEEHDRRFMLKSKCVRTDFTSTVVGSLQALPLFVCVRERRRE